jgi:hypothetical protein
MHLLSPGGDPFLFTGFDAESARVCHDRKIVNAAVSENISEINGSKGRFVKD